MDAEIEEFLECAREADAWAGLVADATLRAQWIEMAADYRIMARQRLEVLLNPAALVDRLPTPPASHTPSNPGQGVPPAL